MNIELLKKLRTRFLRMKHRKHFNMGNIGVQTECGAAMCIAGHALDLAGYSHRVDEQGEFEWRTPKGRRVGFPLDTARRLLGLSYDDAQDMSSKNPGLFFQFKIKTPRQAAKRIERIIETGKVRK
jgi:hypothetical protein